MDYSCALHGKNRRMDYLEPAGDGTWKCKPGFECKVGGGGGGFGMAWQMGADPAAAAAAMPQAGTAVCITHGKVRSLECLQEFPDPTTGEMKHECRPGSACKTGGPRYDPMGGGATDLFAAAMGGGKSKGKGGKPAAYQPELGSGYEGYDAGAAAGWGEGGYEADGGWNDAYAAAAALLQQWFGEGKGGAGAGAWGGKGKGKGAWGGAAPAAAPAYKGPAQAAAQAAAYGMAQDPFAQPQTSGGDEFCSTHGKKRTMRNLQPDPMNPGKYTCMASSQCQ